MGRETRWELRLEACGPCWMTSAHKKPLPPNVFKHGNSHTTRLHHVYLIASSSLHVFQFPMTQREDDCGIFHGAGPLSFIFLSLHPFHLHPSTSTIHLHPVLYQKSPRNPYTTRSTCPLSLGRKLPIHWNRYSRDSGPSSPPVRQFGFIQYLPTNLPTHDHSWLSCTCWAKSPQ
jgi:hypothetical protein